MEVRLAEKDRAGLSKAGHDRRITIGDVVLKHLRSRRRHFTGNVDQVLERNRNAVERPPIDTAAAFGVGFARRGSRRVGPDPDEGVQAGAVALDRQQTGVDELG